MVSRPVCTRFRHRRAARAFTLLEVMVALALSTLLLAAVYMALNLHWKYTTAGRDEIERAQLARAVLNRITLDLRSAVYRAPPPEDSAASADTSTTGGTTTGGTTTGGTTTGGTTGSNMETIDSEVADPTTKQSPGLYGNGDSLMVYISQPSKTLDYAPLFDADRAGHRTSDQQTVSWFLARPGGFGLAGAVGLEREGLARASGDSLSTSLADQQGNLSALVAQTQVLAPEVTFVHFRYHDGTAWRDAWDSAQYLGLPRLVEVTIEIQSKAAPGRTARPPQQYQVMVALPSAKPLGL